jgi:hypothetical protein
MEQLKSKWRKTRQDVAVREGSLGNRNGYHLHHPLFYPSRIKYNVKVFQEANPQYCKEEHFLTSLQQIRYADMLSVSGILAGNFV